MRAVTSGILAAAIASAVAPAAAQTYAPGYPVCLQIFAIDGEHVECAFATMAQCRASAAGLGAQCVANPYSANPSGRKPGGDRRPARMQG